MKVKCFGCGITFNKNPYGIRPTRKNFHSRECHYSYKRAVAESSFFANVKIVGECWNWLGSKIPDGYGNMKRGGRTISTHRLAWIFAKSKIPKGLYVLHKCHNRACINPDHLKLGTHQDNMDDMVKAGRVRNRYTRHIPHNPTLSTDKGT